MDKLQRAETATKIADIMHLAILRTSAEDLPLALRDHSPMLICMRNIFTNISRLDLDLATERDMDCINMSGTDMLDVLKPLNALLEDRSAKTDYITAAVSLFNTSAEITLTRLVPMVSEMLVYAVKS